MYYEHTVTFRTQHLLKSIYWNWPASTTKNVGMNLIHLLEVKLILADSLKVTLPGGKISYGHQKYSKNYYNLK